MTFDVQPGEHSGFYMEIEPPGSPTTSRRRAIEGDILHPRSISKMELVASGDPARLHPSELVEITEEVKEWHYPDVGLRKMRENAQESNGVKVQVEEMKAIEVQNQ